MKKFYIYNTEGLLVEIIDSVDKAFEFLDNEGSYKVEENKRKVLIKKHTVRSKLNILYIWNTHFR